MKYFLKLGFVLLLITVIASGILAFVNDLNKDRISENKEVAQKEARAKLFLQPVSFEENIINLPAKEQEINPLKKFEEPDSLEFVYYVGYNESGELDGYDESDELVGYCFMDSLYGYSSEVKTMVAVGLDFNVLKIDVIDQLETPGLGAKADTPDFEERFIGKNLSQMKVKKDGGKIKAITGATITSRTVTQSIAEGLKKLKKALGREAE